MKVEALHCGLKARLKMTKDLSRQLCELGNIPPVYTIMINVGDLDTNYQKFVYKSKFALLRAHLGDFNDYYKKHNTDWTNCDTYCVNLSDIKEEYPNFETPENFVKLLECVYFNCGGFDSFEKNKTFINDFLAKVVKELIEADLDNSRLFQFKQALQAENWTY